jgi:hypothetical protein
VEVQVVVADGERFFARAFRGWRCVDELLPEFCEGGGVDCFVEWFADGVVGGEEVEELLADFAGREFAAEDDVVVDAAEV